MSVYYKKPNYRDSREWMGNSLKTLEVELYGVITALWRCGLFLVLMALPGRSWAAKAIMEGIAATNNTVFFDTTNARVGISTTTPLTRFTLHDGTNQNLQIYGTASGVAFQGISDNNAVAKNLYIDPAGGNVGVGTTGPSFLLDVNGITRSAGLIRADVGITLGTSQAINSSGGYIILTPATDLYLRPASGSTTFIGDNVASNVSLAAGGGTVTIGGNISGKISISTWSVVTVTPSGAQTTFTTCQASVTITLQGSTVTVVASGSVNLNTSADIIAGVLEDGKFLGTESANSGLVQSASGGGGANMGFNRHFTGRTAAQHTYCIGLWVTGGTLSAASKSEYTFEAKEEPVK